VSASGQRCPAREKIEFDHIEAFANGGLVTATNLRLRCKAHNQYCAELEFGAKFMKQKRESARRAAAKRAELAAARRVERAEANRAEIAQASPAEMAEANRAETAAGQDAEAASQTAAMQRKDTLSEPAVIHQTEELDVIPWLRALGFRADEACHAAEACAHMIDASLEERVKVALSSRARSRPRAA
jgi:hypothetical protein